MNSKKLMRKILYIDKLLVRICDDVAFKCEDLSFTYPHSYPSIVYNNEDSTSFVFYIIQI